LARKEGTHDEGNRRSSAGAGSGRRLQRRHALETAANELLASGFERARISLLAAESAIVEKLGHRYEKVQELEDNLEIPRAVYRSKESFDAGKSVLLGSLASIGAVAAAGAIFASAEPWR